MIAKQTNHQVSVYTTYACTMIAKQTNRQVSVYTTYACTMIAKRTNRQVSVYDLLSLNLCLRIAYVQNTCSCLQRRLHR